MAKIVSKSDVLNSLPLMMIDYPERSSPISEETPTAELGSQFGISKLLKNAIKSFPFKKQADLEKAISLILFPNSSKSLAGGMTFDQVKSVVVESNAKTNYLRMKGAMGNTPDFGNNGLSADAAYEAVMRGDEQLSAGRRFKR